METRDRWCKTNEFFRIFCWLEIEFQHGFTLKYKKYNSLAEFAFSLFRRRFLGYSSFFVSGQIGFRRLQMFQAMRVRNFPLIFINFKQLLIKMNFANVLNHGIQCFTVRNWSTNNYTRNVCIQGWDKQTLVFESRAFQSLNYHITVIIGLSPIERWL